MATSNTELAQFLSKNMDVADSLAEGKCYEPIKDQGNLTGLKEISCATAGAKGRSLTITETGLNAINVVSGQLNHFSGDGRPATHIKIGADKPPQRQAAADSPLVKKVQARMARFSQTGWSEDDEEAYLLAGKVLGADD